MSQVTSANSRKWQRYNRWRSNFRELDRLRRLERVAEKQRAFEAAQSPEIRAPVPRVKAWARISLRFRDGRSVTFAIHELPHGLTISPTLAGRKVAAVLGSERSRR